MEDKFTIKLHHGGTLNSNWEYVGGLVHYWNNVDPDFMSYFEFLDMLKEGEGIVYDSNYSFYYLLPGSPLNTGLIRVFNDTEMLDMCKVGGDHGIVEVFLIHGVNEPKIIEQLEIPLIDPQRQQNLSSEPRNTLLEPLSKSQSDVHSSFFDPHNTNLKRPLKLTPRKVVKPMTTMQVIEPVNEYIPAKEWCANIEEGYESEMDVDYVDSEEIDDLNIDDCEEEEDGGSSTDEELLDSRRRLKDSNKGKCHILDEGASDQEHDLNIPSMSGWESEYENDDDVVYDSDLNSEDNEMPKKRNKVMSVDKDTDFKQLVWKVGMKFPSPELFQDMVRRYAVIAGYCIKFTRCENKKKIEAKCKEGCEWKIYASWDGQQKSFMVKSVQPIHNCNRAAYQNVQAKAKWFAREFLQKFKDDPNFSRKQLETEVMYKFGVKLTKWNCYRVKSIAHQMLHGSLTDHYAKLATYLQEMKKADAEFKFQLQTEQRDDERHVFKRVYISFPGVREGFRIGCRKVICIDGCFLKTFLGGQLLSAIGRDGNNQMFPISWAVVEAENNESWEWFLECLKADLHEFGGEDSTIISDQHKAIMRAIRIVFPKAEHRKCARHIYPPWHKKHSGDGLKVAFWQAVYAYNKADYDVAIQEMGKLSSKAVQDFIKQDPPSFCRFGFRTHTKCNLVVNNLAETFNGWILEARSKPIMDMLEDIRRAVMQRMFHKKTFMEKSKDNIGPRIRKKLETNKDWAKTCEVLASERGKFEVLCNVEVLVVNMETKSCTCRRWDLTGIPCSHVVACCNWLRVPSEEYVHESLRKDVYLQAYNGPIKPLRGERHWETVNFPILPPQIKVGAGRPRKVRRKAPHEKQDKPGKLTKHGIQMTCSICKSKTHNKRKCPKKSTITTTASTSASSNKTKAKNVGSQATSVVRSQTRSQTKAQLNKVASGSSQAIAVPARGRGRPRKGTNTILTISGVTENEVFGTQQSTALCPRKT